MVCAKCEKKLSKLAAPDPFTSTSSSIKSGDRKIGDKKVLARPVRAGPSTASSSSSKARFQPYGSGSGKCKDCKSSVTQVGAKYCHGCAYKKGLCSICGKKILDTTGYVMSSK